MSWIKKTCGVGAFLAAVSVGACGPNPVVGSDGAGGSAGGGGGLSGVGGASINPRPPNTQPTSNSFLTQIAGDVHGACLTFALPQDDAGNPTCHVLSARSNAGCDCKAAGLSDASAEDISEATSNLEINGLCGGKGQQPCSSVCVCAVAPATGKDLEQCQTAAEPDKSATGWCYVSADRGKAPALKLLEACTLNQTNEIRFMGDAAPVAGEITMLACSGQIPPATSVKAALGDPCILDDEYFSTFAGYTASEVNVEDHSSMCSTGVCVVNHFQGRVSCPYGQAAGSADCLVRGSKVPVSGAVQPQLAARMAAQAVVCSCQCNGDGPGPYCTCPESMQCEHLIDELHLSASDLAGSYCIPKGTQYEAKSDQTLCTDPNCGDAHPF